MNKRKIVRFHDLMRGLGAVACAGLLASGASAQSQSKLQNYKGIPGAEKISLQLLEAGSRAQAGNKSLAATLNSKLVIKTANGILLDVVAPGADTALLKAIDATGARVVSASLGAGRLTVEVSNQDQILALGALDKVAMVRGAVPPVVHAGSVESYADRAHGADVARNRYGLDGSGITVGVLSDSFAVSDGVLDEDNDPQTQTINSSTSLTRTLQPGTYTIVVQSPTGVNVTFQATQALAAAACANNGFTISGTTGSLTGLLPISYDNPQTGYRYPQPGCALAGTTRTFVLVSFQVITPGTSVSFLVVPSSSNADSGSYVGLRTGCAAPGDSPQELTCAEPDFTPILINSRPQKTGDLPSSVIILKDGPTGSSDEGAAMAELIHDIAPGAAIAFHTGFVSAADFADGIRKLAGLDTLNGEEGLDEPADIIVDDIGYFDEPWFQPGLVHQAVEQAVAHGSVYFSAAGNSDDHGFLMPYVDAKSGDEVYPIPKGGDLHRWPTGSGFLPIDVGPGDFFTTFLQWNQPFQSMSPTNNPAAGAQIDLDMFIAFSPDEEGLRDASTEAAFTEGRSSINIQGQTGTGVGDAFEAVSYQNTSSVTKRVYLAINHYSGSRGNIPQDNTKPLMIWVVFNNVSHGVQIRGVDPELGSVFSGPTIFGHPNAPSAIAVGAVNYFDTPPFATSFFPTPEIDPEPFTSRGGPFTFYFGAGGLTGGPSVFKPDLSAVDGNNTTFFPGNDIDTNIGLGDFDLDGIPNFFGTSAAAPNAAAIAALMLDANNALTPAQIRGTMFETATDVRGERAAAGTDDVSGVGLINAEAAIDYIFSVFGPDGGSNSSTNTQFQFVDESVPGSPASSTDGWVFEGIPAYFTVPGSAAPAGRLDLIATNNTNTFGYWKSPEVVISRFNQPGGLRAINGGFGPTSLYRVRASVTTDSTNPSETPNFRFRASSRNFERTDELTITSANGGPLAPALGLPRTYDQFFTMAPSQNRFVLYFDVFGNSPDNIDGSRISLEELTVQALDQNQLLNNETLGQVISFRGNSRGWSVRESGLGRVSSAVTPNGLELGPVRDPSQLSFSYWGSPESSPLFNLQRNRLYLLTFTMLSSATSAQKASLPTFRLRANDGTLNFSPLVNIDAQSESSNVPFANVSVPYKLYFLSPNDLEGAAVHLSFDYAFGPNTGADPSLRVILESLKIETYAAPPQ